MLIKWGDMQMTGRHSALSSGNTFDDRIPCYQHTIGNQSHGNEIFESMGKEHLRHRRNNASVGVL